MTSTYSVQIETWIQNRLKRVVDDDDDLDRQNGYDAALLDLQDFVKKGVFRQTFTDWLITADEDDKREASEFRHHYPTEVDIEVLIWDYARRELVVDSSRHEVECGCSDGFGHVYGSEGHE